MDYSWGGLAVIIRNEIKNLLLALDSLLLLTIAAVIQMMTMPVCVAERQSNPRKLPDEVRAQQVKDLEFGMFVCWSFSTFSGREWTQGVHDAAFFKATGCDTDQWCETAKAAEMNYILFLTKHHDGFCLWDTKTTNLKVTESPLGIDVLAQLRKSSDKHGIKLALYYSEGDWRHPRETPEEQKKAAEYKKAQLKELCTRYGTIEFFWMDHAACGDGGLSHVDTVEWIHKFQPNCLVGFNHGQAAGRLCLRERGTPGPLGDPNASKYNKEAEGSYSGYLVAEFTYPISSTHWFDNPAIKPSSYHSPERIHQDYVGALRFGNIFSLDV
ncbi:MAG: alpha-L-fucosidase, partial [Planctomycetota bacterium]